jgi:hypothetical protein
MFSGGPMLTLLRSCSTNKESQCEQGVENKEYEEWKYKEREERRHKECEEWE